MTTGRDDLTSIRQRHLISSHPGTQHTTRRVCCWSQLLLDQWTDTAYKSRHQTDCYTCLSHQGHATPATTTSVSEYSLPVRPTTCWLDSFNLPGGWILSAPNIIYNLCKYRSSRLPSYHLYQVTLKSNLYNLTEKKKQVNKSGRTTRLSQSTEGQRS